MPGRLGLALAALVAALSLAACGSDDESAGQQEQDVDAAGGTAPETRTAPPPETAPSGSGAEATVSRGERQGETSVDATTGPQPCPDVVITPNSDNGLFEVEAQGITCEDATAALEAWGTSGYPGDGPPGFACEELATSPSGSGRLRCEQEASGAVLEFDTGV